MADGSCSWQWDFLLPWCQRVYGDLRYVKGALEDPPGQSFRGLQVQLPSFEASNVRDLREMLGLLSAVAHVDNAAWKKMLLENVNLNVDNQEEMFEDNLMPRYQLALIGEGLDPDEELLKSFGIFCGTEQYTDCSAQYKEALAKIASLSGGKSWTGSTEIEIQVSVQFGPWLTDSSEDMLAYLSKLQETVRAVGAQWLGYFDSELAPLRIAFVLESIMVDLRDVSIRAELVESLACDGIRVSGLALRHELASIITSNGCQDEAREAVGRLMFGLFGGSKNEVLAGNEWGDFDFVAMTMTGPLASEYGHANQLTLNSVHFDCEAMQSWVFERICSAIAVNQTTKHLSLGLELADGDDSEDGDWALCQWRWQWIIFACFSEKARLHSRLESLTLRNAVITTQAVQAMAEVLASDGPEEALLSSTSHPSDAAIDISVKANSPMKLLPMHLDEALNNNRSFKVGRQRSCWSEIGDRK